MKYQITITTQKGITHRTETGDIGQLMDCEEHTLNQIGEKLRITSERVRDLEGRALRRLRHSTNSEGLKPYLDGENYLLSNKEDEQIEKPQC